MKKRLNLRQVGAYVRDRAEFNTNNETLYAKYYNDRYCVFSYGRHWPMYVWEAGVWYEVNERYSRTTTRHMKHARPPSATLLMTPDDMQRLVDGGIVNVIGKGATFV